MIRNGFTLIELLIVIGILAILSGIGIAQYTSYNQTQQVNAAANTFEAALSTARDRAISQDKRCNLNTDTLYGYDVYVGTNFYAIHALCTDSSNKIYEWNAGIPQKQLSANSNISFSAPLYVIFRVQTGGGGLFSDYTGPTPLGTNTFTIQFNGGPSKTVTIDPSGSISVQ